jgi:thioester reductase-like protein
MPDRNTALNQRVRGQSPSYVLLTGATGMVGAQILARLLRNQIPVAVLARARRGRMGQESQSAEQRIEEIVRRFEVAFGQKMKRPVVIRGDINEPKLGIQPAEQQWLRMRCSQVIHSAASLSFQPATESPDNEPYRTNVHGTESLVSLCRDLGINKLHYISTAYVCGEREGNVAEVELDCGQSFSNDYERSKLQAESHLRDCYAAEALTVYRPSIVIDSTGLSPVWQDRTIYGAYAMFNALASKFGLPPRGEWFRNLGLAGDHRKNLVEASWVAETVVGIFEDESLHGQTYHLTSRSGTTIEEMEDAFRMLTIEGLSSGLNRSQIAQTQHALRLDNSRLDTFHTENLSSHQKSMFDAIAAPFVETFLPYFRDDPKFGRRNIDSALQRLGLPEQTEIDKTILDQMIRQGKPSSSDDQSASEPRATSWNSPRLVFDVPSSNDRREAGQNGASWGVVLCGPGGCDIEIDPLQPLIFFHGGESCHRRLYLSVDDWYSLLDGSVSVSSLLNEGRLSIEYDAGERECTEERLVEDADSLIQTLRDRKQDFALESLR